MWTSDGPTWSQNVKCWLVSSPSDSDVRTKIAVVYFHAPPPFSLENHQVWPITKESHPKKKETNQKIKARNCSNQKNWNSKKSILTARRCLTIQRRLWPHQGLVGLEVGRLGMEGTLGRPADRWKPSNALEKWRKKDMIFSRCCQPWDKGNLSNSTPDFMYLSKYIYICMD